jgi:hypothetical protein
MNKNIIMNENIGDNVIACLTMFLIFMVYQIFIQWAQCDYLKRQDYHMRRKSHNNFV